MTTDSTYDMGSLDPLDVGFDIRVHGREMMLQVPDAETIQVRLPRDPKHPSGRVLCGRRDVVVRQLRRAGFSIAK